MSTDRPKRNIIKKKYDDSEGMPWCEERVVRKVLFLSLREFRSGQRSLNTTGTTRAGLSTKRHGHRSTSKGCLTVNGRTDYSQRSSQKQHGSRETSEDNSDRKRPRLQAQRKFAQSQPSSPSSTPLKTAPQAPVIDAPSNHRPPKTEDFLSYLCLRGTVALPDNMSHLGSVQDDADLQEEEEKEMGTEGSNAVNQDAASSLTTSPRSKHQGKMPNCTVFPSHGRCLRGRAIGMIHRPGEALQGAERRERLPTSTTDPTGPSTRASARNHMRYRYPRDSQQLPLVSMATGLSAISSSMQRTKRTPPLRLLPPRAARSSAPPIRPADPPPRSSVPPSSRSLGRPNRTSPSSRSLGRPNRTSALHSGSSTSHSKTRRVKKTKLSFRKRRSNSRHPKPYSRRYNPRHPERNLRHPKSNPRSTSRTGSRHRPAHTNSGKIPKCTAKLSRLVPMPSQVARKQQNRNPCLPGGKLRSIGGLRQSRRRRGLPVETDSASEVMEVRLQVSGPQTRSRTLSHVGKLGREGAVTTVTRRHVGKLGREGAVTRRHVGKLGREGAVTRRQLGKLGREGAVTRRHVGKVPSKPASGQRKARQPAGEVSTLTRQAQSSQG